jgi:ABC-type phosphonate transport system ATPase subunit
MRLRSFRFRHMGPFADAALDLDALPGPLVAVCGVNGAGKTSLLELAFAGALYRTTPTQGTLASRARSRDSFVEAQIGEGRGDDAQRGHAGLGNGYQHGVEEPARRYAPGRIGGRLHELPPDDRREGSRVPEWLDAADLPEWASDHSRYEVI